MRRALLWARYWPLELATLSLWNLSVAVMGWSNWFGGHALRLYQQLEPVAVEWRFQQILRVTGEWVESERERKAAKHEHTD